MTKARFSLLKKMALIALLLALTATGFLAGRFFYRQGQNRTFRATYVLAMPAGGDIACGSNAQTAPRVQTSRQPAANAAACGRNGFGRA